MFIKARFLFKAVLHIRDWHQRTLLRVHRE